MNVYFASAAREYVERRGVPWNEGLVRPLTAEETLLANPKFTKQEAQIFRGEGATEQELENYIHGFEAT